MKRGVLHRGGQVQSRDFIDRVVLCRTLDSRRIHASASVFASTPCSQTTLRSICGRLRSTMCCWGSTSRRCILHHCICPGPAETVVISTMTPLRHDRTANCTLRRLLYSFLGALQGCTHLHCESCDPNLDRIQTQIFLHNIFRRWAWLTKWAMSQEERVMEAAQVSGTREYRHGDPGHTL